MFGCQGVLLNFGQQLTISNISILVILEGNGINKFIIIPIYITLLDKFGLLLFLALRLLLLCQMILIDLSTLTEDSCLIIDILLQDFNLLASQLQDVRVGFDQFHKIDMVLGRRTQKLKLRIIFLTLRQGNEKVFPIASHILSCMLYYCLLTLTYFLWQFCRVPFRLWLFHFLKDSLKEGLLLGWRLLLFDAWWLTINFGLLIGLFCQALDEFFADFSNAMVVIGTIGTIMLQEGKLRFVLFSFHKYLLEV